MIIYIHGFGGSGDGVKANLFKQLSCNEPILAPTLSVMPDMAVMTLSEMIELFLGSSDEKLSHVSLIGSSLGGYYAHYLSHKYNLKAVLLNPALYPYERLAQMIGDAQQYHDESHFEWNHSHVEMLKRFDVAKDVDNSNILLLTQKGDDLLNYAEAVEKLVGAKKVLQEGGSHGFENLQDHFELIAEFLHVNFRVS